MTDEDATSQDPSSGDASSGDSTGGGLPALLLALQAVDTEADQLAHRRDHSALRDEFQARSQQVGEWERRRAALRAEIDSLEVQIAGEEQRDAELSVQRKRLEAQLKTVIAPREAEALMHEIATVEAERDELDAAELAALERQAALDDDLTAHLASEESNRSAARVADEALRVEVAEIEAGLTSLAVRRTELRADVPADVLATYDRKRAALGVAVASLVGKQCQGCHLELSAGEIDQVRADAAGTGVTDCPECGRLLVV